MEVETTTENPRPPWYNEVIKYFKSHNRIGPGKIEMPDCDFFITKPGRTLRILKATPTRNNFYELIKDRPESINENFITRWTKRPHSVNNCRCSFRHSSKLGIGSDKWVSLKMDQINGNLSENEIKKTDACRMDENITEMLPGFEDLLTTESLAEKNDSFLAKNRSANEWTIKNTIVKDLETYIDKLLYEILNDTMKFMSDSENTLHKSRETLDTIKQLNSTTKSEQLQDDKMLKSSLDINFMFPADDFGYQSDIKNNNSSGGFTNQVFVGSDDDPDCLDFYLDKSVINSKNINIIEYVDSGINSVETIEFPTDTDLNLEESLMQIIDEKFGRSSMLKSAEEIQKTTMDSKSSELAHDFDEVDLKDNKLSITNNNCIDFNLCNSRNFNKDNLTISENSADLEENYDISIQDHSKKLSSVVNLCENFSSKFDSDYKTNVKINDVKLTFKSSLKLKNDPVTEIDDNKKMWNTCSEFSPTDDESSKNSAIYERYKKPMIIFLHGFGSSADIFKYQLGYFSQMGYPCIAPDMLGHGMSSAPNKPRDYHFDKLLNDLEVILQHYAFKPGQKCVLVAHNYGCSFASALACKYSNEIHQLVLISGGGPTPLAPPTREGIGHCCIRMVLSPFLMCGLHRDMLYSARGRQHPYCGLESEGQWPSHMTYILDGMKWSEGDYLFHRRICTPTLLIHGLRDNQVSLVQECQMERAIVKAYLEAIPTAGHMPMTDTPEQVNHMIHCFIDLWKRKKW